VLIPSIDLQGGRIVQLVQGERLAIETDDFDGWIARFSRFPRVQLIDLDAAKRTGDNSGLITDICRRLPCRVGGGIRTIERGRAILDAGAHKVIYGSSLFADGAVNLEFAGRLAAAIPMERLIAAVDARDGRVAIDGWRTRLDVTPVDAVRALEPFFGEFLFTCVDVEGLMQGPDFEATRSVKEATSRQVTAAGGVTTEDDVDRLGRMGVDAVAGMAIYTGRLKI
jgi:phosphoribosylformimino-5-aminoimidazole carboxamide ribotide isomerase